MADLDPFDAGRNPWGFGIVGVLAAVIGWAFLKGNLYGRTARDEAATAAADKARLEDALKRIGVLEKEAVDEKARHESTRQAGRAEADDLRDQRDKYRLAAEVLGVRLGIEHPELPPMPQSKLAIVNDPPPRKQPPRR